MKQEKKADYYKRVATFLQKMKGKSKASSAETREMFALHNEWFPKERTTSCDSCRIRVYQKLKDVLANKESIEKIIAKQNIDKNAKPIMSKEQKEILEFLKRITNFRIMDDIDRIWLKNTHNKLFPNKKEVSRNCNACRARMWKRLKEVETKIKQKYDE